MEYFKLSYAGKQWNEDCVYVCENYGFVLDGASTLVKQKFSDMHSDAEWYSSTLGNYLKENLDNYSNTLFKTIEDAVYFIKKEYEKLANGSIIEDFPSSSASIFRINNEKIEFYTIYDSIILVEDIFGNVFDVFDSRNTINDNIVLSYACKKAREEGLKMNQITKKHPEIVLKGRNLRNTCGHQYVLANNVDAVKNGVCFSIDKNLVSKLIILSDGFSQCFDMFKFISQEKFVKKINNIKDAEKMYKKLRRKQKKDPEGQKYLRYKESDDASIVYAKF